MNSQFVPLSTAQSVENPEYSALDLLHRASNDLPKYQRWISKLFVESHPNARSVLDFGCGTGILSKNYFDLTSIRPTGVEIDHRLRAHSQSQGFTVVSTLSELNCKVDYIFSSNVLEHIEDDKEILAELKKILNPDGKLALFVPAFPLLWSAMDDKVGHFRRYRARPLCQMLEREGFLIEQCKYCDSIGFFATLLYKILPTANGEPSRAALAFFDNFLFPCSKILDRALGKILGKNVFVVANLRCEI